MALQQKCPSLIEYVPGNHDLFLYQSLYEGMRNYEKSKNISDLRSAVNLACDNRMNNELDKRNGLIPTYEALQRLVISNPKEVYRLGKWLERQPLLRIEKDNGEKLILL